MWLWLGSSSKTDDDVSGGSIVGIEKRVGSIKRGVGGRRREEAVARGWTRIGGDWAHKRRILHVWLLTVKGLCDLEVPSLKNHWRSRMVLSVDRWILFLPPFFFSFPSFFFFFSILRQKREKGKKGNITLEVWSQFRALSISFSSGIRVTNRDNTRFSYPANLDPQRRRFRMKISKETKKEKEKKETYLTMISQWNDREIIRGA